MVQTKTRGGLVSVVLALVVGASMELSGLSGRYAQYMRESNPSSSIQKIPLFGENIVETQYLKNRVGVSLLPAMFVGIAAYCLFNRKYGREDDD